MARREPITIYVSEAEKEDIKAEAEQADKTLSGYCFDLIQEKRLEDAQEDVSTRLNAEQRLNQTLAEGLEKMNDVAENIEQQNGYVVNLLQQIEEQLEEIDTDADQDADQDGSDTPDIRDRLGDRYDG